MSTDPRYAQRTARALQTLHAALALAALAWTLAALLGLDAAAQPTAGWVLFEDGSFVLGPLTGCLPGGLCSP